MSRENSVRGKRRSTRLKPGRKHKGTSTLVLGIVLGLAAAFGATWLFHRFQHQRSPPELAGEPHPTLQPRRPPPSHTLATAPALQPKAAPESESAPFAISEDVFESGARLYNSRCASCHGTPRRSLASTHPAALQLWQRNPHTGGTGVGRQTPAQIYRSIAEGQPSGGMPAYRGVLTTTQLWQLSLLLSNAGQDLPDPVMRLLDNTKLDAR